MPKIEIISYGSEDEYGEVRGESTEVLLDGKRLLAGWYGGEPEDNTRGRTYSWVESALSTLAEALGAEVVFTTKEGDCP